MAGTTTTTPTKRDDMKISECFPSKFLKAADIPAGREVEVVIERAEREEVDPGVFKPALYFIGKPKGLVLNPTNGYALRDVLGDETDGWIGKRIVIFATTTTYMGRPVGCLRVRPLANPAPPPVTPSPDPPGADETPADDSSF